LADPQISEVAYWLNFASPQVVKFHIDPVGRATIRVWSADDADPEDIGRKIRATVTWSVDGQQSDNGADDARLSVRVGAPRGPAALDPDDAVAAGVLTPLGIADVVIGEPLVTLIRLLDDAFRELATGFGATQAAYSSLLSVDYLERLRYFDAFPQNVLFPVHLTTDIDTAQQYVERTLDSEGRPPRDGFEGFAPRDRVLAPAACFHVYQGLEGRQLATDTAITTLGRCYRYESRNAMLIERLWDFSMREVVFVGTPAYVRSSREESQRRVLELVDRWGLGGSLVPGHDPFFLRGARPDAVVDPQPKFELRLDLPYKDADFACASFNVHGTFFGSVGEITGPTGDVAWTGCAAFGLERWAWAILARHGLDPDAWPADLLRRYKQAA
jgi:seryl-tRNA synthetase